MRISKHHFKTLAAFATILCIGLTACAQEPRSYAERREALVEELSKAGPFDREAVKDKRVLEAMREVRRHKFVDTRIRDRAYQDTPLPIGYGQTISQPYIVAKMTELLDVKPEHKVLEIGTGSGYQAAILSELVKTVYTIELLPELGKQAKKLLKELGYDNVEVRIGDGYKGWPEHAPFDRIIVTAAPEEVPQALVDQLKPGGKMVLPVGERYGMQELKLLQKTEDGELKEQSLLSVRFVPMKREDEVAPWLREGD